MKRFIAELVGTFVLTLLGCGTAVSLNCGVDAASVVGTAMAFGIAVIAMAYTIGGTSGCHINPAITLGCLLSKRISGKDAAMYMLFQTIGAILASCVLYALVTTAPGLAEGTTTGANSCAGGVTNGLIAEIVLTAIFVFVVLGTTDSKVGAGNFAGLAIGMSLILIHLVGIHYTGTSVNPARSIGPAIFAKGQALAELWVFIIGPFIGAAIAAILWKVVGPCCCNKD